MAWFLFILLSVMVIGGGLGVVTTRNVVHACLFLLFSLLAVAGLYVVLLAEFLAVVQIFIYGGAIIIVLLFAIMLTRSEEYPSISDNSQWPLAVVSGLALFSLLTATFVVNSRSFEVMHRVALTDLGTTLFTDWALPFEIASIVLLLALIGSIVIAKVERRR